MLETDIDDRLLLFYCLFQFTVMTAQICNAISMLRLLYCAVEEYSTALPYHAIVVYCILSRSTTILQNRSE